MRQQHRQRQEHPRRDVQGHVRSEFQSLPVECRGVVPSPLVRCDERQESQGIGHARAVRVRVGDLAHDACCAPRVPVQVRGHPECAHRLGDIRAVPGLAVKGQFGVGEHARRPVRRQERAQAGLVRAPGAHAIRPAFITCRHGAGRPAPALALDRVADDGAVDHPAAMVSAVCSDSCSSLNESSRRRALST